MPGKPTIALVGDYHPEVVAHQAIPGALALAGRALGRACDFEWVATERIRDAPRDLAGFSGIWVVPASPYKSTQGALEAIRHARESRLPFLGTCGGFQHALVEFARNVAGIPAADHAESSPDAAVPVVTLLCCSLVGASGEIHFTPGSRLAAIFNGNSTVGEYRCSYGLNPDYRARLEEAGLRFSGFDADEEIRALELPSHPFFIGTLFQPERSSFSGKAHPLVTTFVEAVVGGGIDA